MDDSRFHAEESLEKCLADAYESMSPDEEARRRMLAELLAASERRAPKRRLRPTETHVTRSSRSPRASVCASPSATTAPYLPAPKSSEKNWSAPSPPAPA